MLRKLAFIGLLFVMCIPSISLAGQDGGYDITTELWAKAILQVTGNPVTLVWEEVGTDTTPSGDTVVSGYFYANPDDFAYGSQYNPEVFVKVYIATNGWCNMAFNHVTVDDVAIYSAHDYAGTADQTGTVSLTSRLLEHRYDGVGSGTGSPIYDATGTWPLTIDNVSGSLVGSTQCEFDDYESDVLALTQSGSFFSFINGDGNSFTGTINGSNYNFTGTWIDNDNFVVTVTGTLILHSSNSLSGSGHVRIDKDGGLFCEWVQSYSGVKR